MASHFNTQTPAENRAEFSILVAQFEAVHGKTAESPARIGEPPRLPFLVTTPGKPKSGGRALDAVRIARNAARRSHGA